MVFRALGFESKGSAKMKYFSVSETFEPKSEYNKKNQRKQSWKVTTSQSPSRAIFLFSNLKGYLIPEDTILELKLLH